MADEGRVEPAAAPVGCYGLIIMCSSTRYRSRAQCFAEHGPAHGVVSALRELVIPSPVGGGRAASDKKRREKNSDDVSDMAEAMAGYRPFFDSSARWLLR